MTGKGRKDKKGERKEEGGDEEKIKIEEKTHGGKGKERKERQKKEWRRMEKGRKG